MHNARKIQEGLKIRKYILDEVYQEQKFYGKQNVQMSKRICYKNCVITVCLGSELIQNVQMLYCERLKATFQFRQVWKNATI